MTVFQASVLKCIRTMRRILIIATASLLAVASSGTICYAGIRYNSLRREWTLQSNSVEYRLAEQDGSVYLEYFGPSGGSPWPNTLVPHGGRVSASAWPDLAGIAEGQGLSSEDLKLVSQATNPIRAGADQLTLTYQHRRLPLQIIATYTTWASTGVITRQLTLVNTGKSVIHIESLPSLAWTLPGGRYKLTYLWGGWSRE
jgi:Glycosyl hydrolase family 36 N-terminal domain